MPHIIHLMLTVLVLAGLLLLEPQRGLCGLTERDPSEKSALILQCAQRLETWFPLITNQSQELDLDHVKILRLEQQLVVIPLKQPYGHVRGIRGQPKELTEKLDYIRLLQQGKIGAVNLLPFLSDPAELYTSRGNVLEELKGCQQKEPV